MIKIMHDHFFLECFIYDCIFQNLLSNLAKKIKEAMAGLVQSTWAKLSHSPNKASTFKMGFKEEEPALIHVIQAKEELAQHIKGTEYLISRFYLGCYYVFWADIV